MNELNKEPTEKINLKILALRLLKKWRFFCVFAFVGACAGFGLSFCVSKQYTSVASFVPISSGGSSLLSSLTSQAGLLGILGSQSSQDEHLEDIIMSREFLQPYVHQRWLVDSVGVTKSTLELLKIKTDSLKRVNLLVDSNYLVEEVCIGSLRKMVKLLKDAQSGLTKLTVTAPDPIFAYSLDTAILERIKTFNNKNRLLKVSKKRAFVEVQLSGFEKNLEIAENRMIEFRAQNKAINSPALETREGQLARDIQIATSLVIEFRKQVELVRLDEESDNDYLEVIESPSIPMVPSSLGSKKLALFGFFVGAFLGFVISLFLVLNNDKSEKSFA